MAHKLQIQYDDMDTIAGMFDSYADGTEEQMQKINRCVEDLRGDGWIGLGADKFYAEMDDEVMPRLKLLKSGFETAGKQTRRMSQMFQDAEQTILAYFANL